MITDQDIKKMKKVFTTKDDLKPIHKKMDLMDKKLDDLTEYVVPALGSIFKWTDDIHRAFVGSKRSSKQLSES